MLYKNSVSVGPNEQNLGVTLTNTLYWDTHIENVLKTWKLVRIMSVYTLVQCFYRNKKNMFQICIELFLSKCTQNSTYYTCIFSSVCCIFLWKLFIFWVWVNIWYLFKSLVNTWRLISYTSEVAERNQPTLSKYVTFVSVLLMVFVSNWFTSTLHSIHHISFNTHTANVLIDN